MYKLQIWSKQTQQKSSKLIKRPKQQQHLKQEPPPQTTRELHQLQRKIRATKTIATATTQFASKLEKATSSYNNNSNKQLLLYYIHLLNAYQQQLRAFSNLLHLITHFLQSRRAHQLIESSELRYFIDYT